VALPSEIEAEDERLLRFSYPLDFSIPFVAMTTSVPANLIPANEEQRLRSLHALQILDTQPEEDFDDLTTLASQIVGAPIALITLVDRDRQWFKSKVGLNLDQTSRSGSFCAHAILGDTIFEVEDATKDARFSENPLVTGPPGIRFYAGMPLTTPEGTNVGTLCTIDHVPRKLDEDQRRGLKIIARQVMAQIELRRLLRGREVRENLIRDPLTNLFTRRYMEATLERELHRMERVRLPLGILALDLDHFKQLNDTHGLGTGDAVLRAFAALLQSTFRQDDIVCRSGGDEFLIILPTADAKMIQQRADDLRQSTERLQISYRGNSLAPITISGGAAIFPQHGMTGSELIRAADVALCQAKERGRNRIVMTGTPAGASAG
jgi:diguanylate cyclase (GGDEF)-like protein